MARETMLSALAEESSPPSSCLQPRSPSDPPFEAITLSPGQAHQRISSHLRRTFAAPRLELDPNPGCKKYMEDQNLNKIIDKYGENASAISILDLFCCQPVLLIQRHSCDAKI